MAASQRRNNPGEGSPEKESAEGQKERERERGQQNVCGQEGVYVASTCYPVCICVCNEAKKRVEGLCHWQVRSRAKILNEAVAQKKEREEYKKKTDMEKERVSVQLREGRE